MKERFITKNFHPTTEAIIRQANVIIDEYNQQGYQLTLRQLYYQFVARGLIENTERSYKNLGNIISDARLCGLIDWYAIEDRTRGIDGPQHFRDPAHIIDVAARSYHIDKWDGQEYRVEVWVEKEALTGVVEPVCRELDIKWLACRGYVSQSELWRAGHRMRGYLNDGIIPVILHLGDHDPSGIDMSRDNMERISLFSANYGVVFHRVALNYDQIDEYNPPPNPAKVNDSRYKSYQNEFGKQSWELDALEPRVISDLIRNRVLEYRDESLWEAAKSREDEDLSLLGKVSDRWKDIVKYIKSGEV